MTFLCQSVRNLTFLDTIRFKSGAGEDERFIPIHLLASELGLPTCCLLPAMHATQDVSLKEERLSNTKK